MPEATGWVVSAVLHVGVLGALAAWATVAPSELPIAAGRTNVASLEVEFAQSEPDLPPDEAPRFEAQVVVMPQRAQVAERRFVHVPTGLARPAVAESAPVTLPPASVPLRGAAAAGLDGDVALPLARMPRHAPPIAALGDASPQQAGTDETLQPELLDNAPPLYPAEAIRNGWQGTVVLRIRVTAEGRVGELTVYSTSGFPVLDAAAVRAVRSWRFRPALGGGRPVECTIRLPVAFVF